MWFECKYDVDGAFILLMFSHILIYSLEYYISAGNKSVFSIEKSNPKLSTKRKLDYEVATEYNIVIVAQDLADRCHKSRAMVHVNVIDQNDNFPTFLKKEYTASIAKNAPTGSFVIKVLRLSQCSWCSE